MDQIKKEKMRWAENLKDHCLQGEDDVRQKTYYRVKLTRKRWREGEKERKCRGNGHNTSWRAYLRCFPLRLLILTERFLSPFLDILNPGFLVQCLQLLGASDVVRDFPDTGQHGRGKPIIMLRYCVACSHSLKSSQCLCLHLIGAPRICALLLLLLLILLLLHPLCNLCSFRGGGLLSLYSMLCYWPINRDAPSFFLSLLFPFLPSIPSSPTSARQPIHLMQFSFSLSLRPCHLPFSPSPLSLSLSLAQVMSYFFSWILLPPLSLSKASH